MACCISVRPINPDEMAESEVSVTVHPWRWIVVASSVPTLLCIGGLLILVLPFIRGGESPPQVVLGLAVVAYFGVMVHSCVTAHVSVSEEGIKWSDPFSRGSFSWPKVQSLDVAEVQVPNFWMVGQGRFRYNGLNISTSDSGDVTVGASLLSSSQRDRLYGALRHLAKAEGFRLLAERSDLGASLRPGRTLDEIEVHREQAVMLHYRLSFLRWTKSSRRQRG
jgi:hypothetical protein